MEKSNSPLAEDLLASLMNNAPLGIIFINDAGIVTHANYLVKVLLHLEPLKGKITGRHILECIGHIPELHDRLSSFIKKKRKSINTKAISIQDRYIILKGVRIPNGFICIINEVTRLKKMEIESIQSIITGQENERRRIAREIHDGIGPLLSYSKLELDAYMDEYVDSDRIAEEKLMNIRQNLDSITNDMRDLSHHLIPRLLEEFGLISAFSSLVTKLNNTISGEIKFYSNFESEIRFDQDLELNLYRCGQELINNAVKYAKATEILVQLIKHENSIILMVEDDGIGFDQQEQNPENFGIGLTNIETRARTLDGIFLIESRANKGTSASVELPFKKL